MMDGGCVSPELPSPIQVGRRWAYQLHERAGKNTPHQASLVMRMHIAPCMVQGKVRLFFLF